MLLCVGWHQMAYESWREQVEEGEQKTRNGEIGSVFLIDRGMKQDVFPTMLQMAAWLLSL